MFRGSMVYRREAWKGLTLALAILGCQLLLILAVSSAWVYLKGVPAGYSSLYGGGIYVIPQLLFSLFALNRQLGPGSAGWVLWDFYVGAGIKLVSTVALFVVVLTNVESEHLPLYVTYALSLCFQWVITIVLNNRY
ncbi:ATP synthase subunit I [Aeromonas veronii]|nr:ATP synthase subunit I [Aeromonas veronii]EKP0310005.1 ATP synthase subunit I [Aeromonas veronii]